MGKMRIQNSLSHSKFSNDVKTFLEDNNIFDNFQATFPKIDNEYKLIHNE